MRRTPKRRLAATVATVVLTALVATGCSSGGDDTDNDPSWVGAWYAAMTPVDDRGTPSGDGFTDTTLRQSVHVATGGDSLRLRLSNAYGTKPLELGTVTVAAGDASANVDDGSFTEVTFGGSSSTTVPVGAEWVSDPVDLSVDSNSDLVVSMHLPGPTGPATVHPLGMSTSYRASGDQASAPTSDFNTLDESRYFLTGVDVATEGSEDTTTTVFFGDSITDGHSSTVDANMRYPDQVFDRIDDGDTAGQCTILNAGISGNRMLTDDGTHGVSAMSRFDTDLLARPDVTTVVLLEGINDIGTSDGEVRPEEIIASYRQFIDRAHDHGLTVIGATLTPFTDADYFTDAGEETRQSVNDWIRDSGEFDDVIDFDDVVRDPAAPERIHPDFDSDDHLHPNDAGYTAMADAADTDTICR